MFTCRKITSKFFIYNKKNQVFLLLKWTMIHTQFNKYTHKYGEGRIPDIKLRPCFYFYSSPRLHDEDAGDKFKFSDAVIGPLPFSSSYNKEHTIL